MSDQITNTIVSMLDKIQAGVTNVAPQAIELVLKAIAIKGIQHIAVGALFLFFSIFSFLVLKKAINNFKKNHRARKERVGVMAYVDEKEKDDLDFELVLFGGGGLISFIISMSFLLNIWNYVAAFEPKLYLAHEVIEKVISKGDK